MSQFIDAGDDDAFAGLVVRHGPMVYAVCRRIAGDVHLADDSYQATFLILARRARAVRPREAVRGWLYGVAVRIARTARTRAESRLRREMPVSSVPDRPAPVTSEPDSDCLRVLDEEIGRLPERLRAAVVLCELDGVSRKDAAARLGVPEGTVSSRLAAARKTLASRLRARGLLFSAAGLGVGFSQLAVAAVVPARLSDSAIRLAAAGAVPAGVADLAQGVFKSMFMAKLTAVLTVAALVVAGFASAESTATQPTPQPTRPPQIPRQSALALVSPLASVRAPIPPAGPREGVIVVTSFNHDSPVELFKPDGTSTGEPVRGEARALWMPRLTADGKRLAAGTIGPFPEKNDGPWTVNNLYLLDLDAKEGPKEPILSDLRCPSVVWSRDGAKLYGSQINPDKVSDPIDAEKPYAMVSWVYDLGKKAKTTLALPEGHAIVDVSPDGKTLLTIVRKGLDERDLRTHLVPLDTLKSRLLTEKVFKGMRFSPDGKSVLGVRAAKPGDAPSRTLVVVSVIDGSERAIPLPDGATGLGQVCWAPDGKRIAFAWLEEIPQPRGTPVPAGPGPHKWSASRVTVADADGRNAKVIIRREHNQSITGIDWR